MKFMKARGIGVYDFCECVGLSTHISTRSRCDRCKFNWSLQTLAPLPPEPWIAPYRHNRHIFVICILHIRHNTQKGKLCQLPWYFWYFRVAFQLLGTKSSDLHAPTIFYNLL